jgi:uncharacterized protein YndB with AHSA1/START domain
MESVRKMMALMLLSYLFAQAASAAVAETTPVGFGVMSTVTTAATPKKVYSALTHDIGKWWNAEHTYSGDSHNLSMPSKVGGCFCERVSHGGAVEHAHVIMLIPDSQVRMTGAFGPLQSSGLVGTLSYKISPAGTGSKIEMTYNVGGYMHGSFENIAPAVDEVLTDQLTRLKTFAETGKPK